MSEILFELDMKVGLMFDVKYKTETKFGAQFFFCTCKNVFRDSIELTYSLSTFPQPPVSFHVMHPVRKNLYLQKLQSISIEIEVCHDVTNLKSYSLPYNTVLFSHKLMETSILVVVIIIMVVVAVVGINTLNSFFMIV